MEINFHLHPVVPSKEATKADISMSTKRVDPARVWDVVCPRSRILHPLLEARIDAISSTLEHLGALQLMVEMLVEGFVDVQDRDSLPVFRLDQNTLIQHPRDEVEEWEGGVCGELH
jgi:hypothetical protein